MRIFANAAYPFLQWRRKAYIVTAVLLLGGLAAMIANIMNPEIRSWLRYGVDFTGGTIVQLQFPQPTSVDQIRQAATGRGWEIFRFGTENEFIVRMQTFDQTTADAAQQVTAALTPVFGEGGFNVVRTEAVGPKVGDELQRKALIAILLSLVGTLIYLAFRFEWRFGVAAVVATAHDIAITLGFLAAIRSEISVGTVAALLTVVGYSLNDTIVVFDRIRENLAKPGARKNYVETLNRAINETLPRTILTGVTTLATLLSLLIFGGPVIRDFSLVLILGIVIGTFSSIFVASPILRYIESRWPHQPATGSAAAGAARRRDPATVR
jgi:preprotein translocase subunit SecF